MDYPYQTKVGDGLYFTVPKGTVIVMLNPLMDKDVPDTLYLVRACLDEDAVVCFEHNIFPVTVLERVNANSET